MDPRMARNSKEEYNYGEQDGTKRPNQPGVYYHPEAKAFIESAYVKRADGTKVYPQGPGKIQADAFAQIGYRPATTEELEEYEAREKEKAAKKAKDEVYNLSKPSGRGRS